MFRYCLIQNQNCFVNFPIFCVDPEVICFTLLITEVIHHEEQLHHGTPCLKISVLSCTYGERRRRILYQRRIRRQNRVILPIRYPINMVSRIGKCSWYRNDPGSGKVLYRNSRFDWTRSRHFCSSQSSLFLVSRLHPSASYLVVITGRSNFLRVKSCYNIRMMLYYSSAFAIHSITHRVSFSDL